MPDHLLKQIGDALLAHATGLSGIGKTGWLTDVGKMWMEEQNPPALYLGDAGDEIEDGPTRSRSSIAHFFFHVIVRGDVPTALYYSLRRQLEVALEADPTLGGLGHNARITRADPLNTAANIAKRTFVADLFIDVDYRHARGNP